MRVPIVVGDLTLTARPASDETFRPFGRLLGVGERVTFSDTGTLLALDRVAPGPRRVTHLVRYPEAQRALVPLGPGALLLVVLPPGERPGGPPAAFLLPSGTGVLLRRGVWHAGPLPLSELPLLELLETPGPVDRMDRRPLRDLVGAEAARVALPDEDVGRPPRFHLEQPNSLLVEPHVGERVRLALLSLDGLDVHASDDAGAEQAERLAETLRAAYATQALEHAPGVLEGRALFRAMGLDGVPCRPQHETLLAQLLDGRTLPRVNAFADALALAALRQRVQAVAFDADRLGEQVLVRLGAPGEAYPPAPQASAPLSAVSAEGRPLLADREGPCGGPLGEAPRVRVKAGTTRALVVAFLPPSAERGAVEAALDGLAAALVGACGGKERARQAL